MRRLFIFLMVAMLAFGALRAIRSGTRPPHHYGPHHSRRSATWRPRPVAKAQQAAAEASRAIRGGGSRGPPGLARDATRRSAGPTRRRATRSARRIMRPSPTTTGGRTLPSRRPRRAWSRRVRKRKGCRCRSCRGPGSPGPRPGRRSRRVRRHRPRLASQARPPAPTAPACEDRRTCCDDDGRGERPSYRPISGEIGATEDRAGPRPARPSRPGSRNGSSRTSPRPGRRRPGCSSP